MRAFRRILIFGFVLASVLLLVAIGAVLSAPFWVDTNAVKKEIAALVYRATGDVVQLDRLQLHLFPSVSVDIARPRYTVAGSAEVAAESAVIDLDFLALISGRVQPRGIRFSGLQATIHLPPPVPDQNPTSLAAVEQQLRDALVQIGKAVPALSVAADAAVITLDIPGQPPFALHVLHGQARTAGDSVAVELACASEAWQWLSLKFSLKGNELTGSGLAEFTGLRVERLRALLGTGDWPIAEAEVIGRVEWQMNGLSNVRAEAIASSSTILLQRNNSTQSLDGVVAAAGLETRGSAVGLHLHRLYVAAPHLLMSANLSRDDRGKHQFDMQASGVDLRELQAAARGIAPDIQWISNSPVSFRAGALTSLEFHSSADAIPQLFDPSVLAGGAAFADVALDVARPALRLSAVEGRVTLDRGALQVQSIKAALGNSVLRNGKMSANLLGRPVTLQANAVVAVNLAEALALARKVVTQQEVRRHLDAVEELAGSALARIALSGNPQSLNTAVDLSELAFSARHRDVPLPIRLSQGQVVYTGDAISISDAAGEIGRSGFSDLDASMKLTPPYRFDLTQLTALLSMDELFPIAAVRPELRTALAELQAVSGAITLTNVQADGSLEALDASHFRVGAAPRNMKINARRFAPQILLDGGQVDISNRRIEVNDMAMAALDSELHVSGHSDDYRAGIAAVDAIVNGRLGANTLEWIYQTTETPRAYQVNAPLRFADAKIGWKNSSEVAFKGKVNIAGTADLFIDARKADNSFKFERVTLKDPFSEASLGGELAGKIVKAWFKGKLAGETLKRMLVEPALSLGSLEGDIAVDMDLGKPEEMHAKGQLQGVAIAATGKLAFPVGVERIALTADGKRVTVSDAVLSNGENRAELSGNLYREGNRFVVDGDVRAGRIVLPALSGRSKSGDEGGGRTFKLEDLPVAGRIGVNIQSIEAGSLKLAPLVAEARVSGTRLDLRIAQAALCDITLSGGIVGEMDDLQMTATLSARDAAFADSIGCLTKDRVQGSGRMDVDAHFTARGAPKTLGESLAGRFSLAARDGNLEKFDTLNRIFAVLNVTEVVRGKQLAFSEKGMRYRVAGAKGTLEGKVLHFDEFTLDAPTVYLAATGRIDYGNGKMAMDVMVAPLQTANTILDKIPLLGRIFGGAILALPVQIAGTVQHPIVVPLGPGAVATRMKSIFANTLRLPFDAIKIFSPNADQGVNGQAAAGK